MFDSLSSDSGGVRPNGGAPAPVKVKICGLFRPEDILAANQAEPDYVGFVFAPGSKRHVTLEEADRLKSLLSPKIPSVGVFVNAQAEEIAAAARAGIIDMAQLHGDESAQQIARVSSVTGLSVIKAVRVRTARDIYDSLNLPCDYLLLDTYSKGQYGGVGKQFDWSLIPAMPRPFFLAGGLSASNVEEASRSGAYCLDLSSAVETEGKKDPDKMIHIVKKIRSIPSCQMENSESTADSSSLKP